MLDTVLLRPSLHCNTPPHFTTLHPTALHYTSLHFTQLHFTALIDTSLPLIYTSLPFHLALRIYISYRSISHHITSLNKTQYRSHPQNYCQKRKPPHCPKELLTISLHILFSFILFYFILFYVFICLLILSTLHFASLCYS
jgi:hypothetical protein